MKHLDSALTVYRTQRFDSAEAALGRLLDQAITTGDSFVETEALTWLALAQWRQGSLRTALEHAQRSLEAKRRYGLTDSLFRSYNALGLISYELGQLTTAAQYFDRAVAEADRLESPGQLATAIGNRGLILHDLGDFAGADSAFRRLREAGRALSEPRFEANALTNLGKLAISAGDPAAALPYLDTAVAIYRRTNDANVQVAWAQLHEAYMALGRPADAFAALDTALKQSRQSGERDEEARNLQALGDYYRDGGDIVRARSLYDSAQALYQALDEPIEAGSTHRTVAGLFLAVNDLRFAQARIDSAIQLHRAADDRFQLFQDLLALAEIQARGGQPNARTLDEAHAIAQDFDAPSFAIALALTEARIADHAGEPARVLEILRPFDSGAIPVNAPTARAEIDWLLSRAYSALGRGARALERARSAVQAVDQVREGFGSAFFRASFASSHAPIYGHLARLLLASGAISEGLEVMDAAHGRALAEHLTGWRQPSADPNPTLRQLAELETLRRTITQLSDRVLESDAAGGERRAGAGTDLAERLAKARSRFEMLTVEVMERDRAATALLGQRRAGFREVQGALRNGEALVEYLVTDERLLAVWLTADSIWSASVNVSATDLGTKVRVAREILSNPHTESIQAWPVLQDLHELLLRPIRANLARKATHRLILVPHAFLNYLPFAALRDRSGRYLVEDYELAVLPTASALWALRARATSRSRGQQPAGAAAFAPFDRRLPATGSEVRNIERSLNGVRVRVGRRATETALRRALTERAVVHVATHAALNPRNPLFSTVELTRGRSHRGPDDGRLELHEVLTLHVRSALVFLSGCETAAGAAWTTRYRAGEDYATLAQALLYAGAGNVVATLWRIQDAGAARFAAWFYEALPDRDPVAALAIAQRKAIGSPELQAPYYWAPYLVSGVEPLGSQ